MASPKSPASNPLTDVQVLDSSEPLDTAVSYSVQEIDYNEPLVPVREQVLDSSEPLVWAESSSSVVLDSNDPLATTFPYDCPMGEAGPSGLGVPRDDEERPVSGTPGRRLHPSSEEIRSMWNWRKIFSQLGTHRQCIQFAEAKRLIPTEKLCKHHHRPMTIRTDCGLVGQFRCRKSQCRTKPSSRAVGTWFENAKLSLRQIFQLMYAFSEGLSYHQAKKQCADEENPVLSDATVSDWYSCCRETIVLYTLEHQEYNTKIGGPNISVQIEKSKFGKRKFNRGSQIEGHWVIGMIEDGNDDLRLGVCPDNDTSNEILVPLIKKHVQEGSILQTDDWSAYLALPEHGYINHSDTVNRVVALDGTESQRIGSQWRSIRKEFKKHNKKDFADWIVEYSWRRKIKIDNKDPFEELIKAISYVYNIN